MDGVRVVPSGMFHAYSAGYTDAMTFRNTGPGITLGDVERYARREIPGHWTRHENEYRRGMWDYIKAVVVERKDQEDLKLMDLPAWTIALTVEEEKRGYVLKAKAQIPGHPVPEERNEWMSWRRVFSTSSRLRCEGARELLWEKLGYQIRRNQRRVEQRHTDEAGVVR